MDKPTERVPAARSRRFLKELIEYRSNRGFITRLSAELSRVVGRPVKRQEIEMWLCDDEERRVEPRLGMALLLVQVGLSIKNEMELKYAKNS
jgi:hypothetical protein